MASRLRNGTTTISHPIAHPSRTSEAADRGSLRCARVRLVVRSTYKVVLISSVGGRTPTIYLCVSCRCATTSGNVSPVLGIYSLTIEGEPAIRIARSPGRTSSNVAPPHAYKTMITGNLFPAPGYFVADGCFERAVALVDRRAVVGGSDQCGERQRSTNLRSSAALRSETAQNVMSRSDQRIKL